MRTIFLCHYVQERRSRSASRSARSPPKSQRALNVNYKANNNNKPNKGIALFERLDRAHVAVVLKRGKVCCILGGAVLRETRMLAPPLLQSSLHWPPSSL